MTMISKIKTSLRVVSTAFDDEITDLINASVADLKLAGVERVSNTATDPLIIAAMTTYVKWRFGSPENPEQLRNLYELQKAQLQVASQYKNG